MPPQKSLPTLDIFTNPPVLSPPRRPYLIPGFYVTYICSFTGDVLSHFVTDTYAFCTTFVLSYRSHEPCATVTMDNNYGPMVPKAL